MYLSVTTSFSILPICLMLCSCSLMTQNTCLFPDGCPMKTQKEVFSFLIQSTCSAPFKTTWPLEFETCLVYHKTLVVMLLSSLSVCFRPFFPTVLYSLTPLVFFFFFFKPMSKSYVFCRYTLMSKNFIHFVS